MPQPKPTVVIIGAGFGGLEAAKTLRRAPVEITVIDRQDENIALLLDARLNKDGGSAKLAASRYLADYEEARKNRNVEADHLAAYARKTASAAFEVYTITHDQDAASSSILVRFGKDPSSIFAPGPEMKLKDCEAF
jgi:NADH:quinone reductase (non-electrogenic)